MKLRNNFFNNSIKKNKIIRDNILKQMKDLYTKNYKTSSEEIKEGLNK